MTAYCLVTSWTPRRKTIDISALASTDTSPSLSPEGYRQATGKAAPAYICYQSFGPECGYNSLILSVIVLKSTLSVRNYQILIRRVSGTQNAQLNDSG